MTDNQYSLFRPRPKTDAEICATWRASPKGAKHREKVAISAQSPPEQKLCTFCKTVKPQADFYRTSHDPTGLMTWCKLCVIAQRKSPAGREVARRTRNKNREKILAATRAWRAKVFGVPEGKATRRAAKIKWTYGLTTEDFERMRAEQNDGCAICKRAMSTGRPLCVDHDHKTGKVRGLLCVPCNSILGRWKDDPAICENAKQYILKHAEVIEPPPVLLGEQPCVPLSHQPTP